MSNVESVGFRAVVALVACCAPVVALGACSRPKPTQPAAIPAKAPRLSTGGPIDPALRHLRSEETTPEIARRARQILDANPSAPFGTEVPFEVDGRSYVGRIEEHYHEPGGPRRPWGRHRGVTVYRAD
jgi:hypothetical protein